MLNVHFVRANLENKNLSGRNFDGVDFRKANLRRAILNDISCEPAKVSRRWLRLLEMFLGSDSFSPNKMKSTNFSEADLTGAKLKRAKLREADFHNAILRQADLTGASLVSAYLNGADLTNANLSYADMSEAILYNTNLEGADLTGVKLDGADLENANLRNAILHWVDMREVKFLSSANLTGADLSNTIMPEEKEKDGQTAIPAAAINQQQSMPRTSQASSESSQQLTTEEDDQLMSPSSANQQLEEPRHSILGILSFLVSLVMIMVVFGSINIHTQIILPVVSLIGVGFAVAGLREPNRKRLFPLLGLIINGFAFLVGSCLWAGFP